MAKEFYRTGQVAKVLGLSTHQVRRLCETRLVKGELGPGGHWRIPASEIARLQKEGVPLIPSAVDESDPVGGEMGSKSGARIKAHSRHDLVAPPSQTLISSEVPSTGNHLEQIAKETCFRERSLQEEENENAAHAFIHQKAASQVARERQQWHNRWLEWALGTLPLGVPEEYRLEVREEADKILHGLQPQTPESLTRKLVEGAVQKGLRTWRSLQDTEKALGVALRQLPWLATSPGKPTKWQIRAREEANSAISKLPDGASFEAKLAAATAAVQKITLEFEDETLRQKIIEEAILLPLLSSSEKEDAKAAVRTSVESSRPGSSKAELRRARQAALKSFEDTQRQRESRQRLERRVD